MSLHTILLNDSLEEREGKRFVEELNEGKKRSLERERMVEKRKQ